MDQVKQMDDEIKDLMANRSRIIEAMNQARRKADEYATQAIKVEGSIEALVKLKEQFTKNEDKKDG